MDDGSSLNGGESDPSSDRGPSAAPLVPHQRSTMIHFRSSSPALAADRSSEEERIGERTGSHDEGVEVIDRNVATARIVVADGFERTREIRDKSSHFGASLAVWPVGALAGA